MEPIPAPSELVPTWVAALAVLLLSAAAWFGAIRPALAAPALVRRPFDRRAQWLLVAAAGAVGLVVLLGVLGTPVDRSVSSWFAERRSTGVDVVAIVITNLVSPFGGATVAVLAAVLLMRRYQARWIPMVVLAPPLLAAALNTGLKALIGKQRPADQVVITTDASFPSGHSVWAVTTWGCLAVALYLLTGRHRWLPLLIVPMIAAPLTRVYLGAHWLSDVLAGASLGLAVVLVTFALARRVATPTASAVTPLTGPDPAPR